ncbi:hypothetical protein QAD02_020052 [Eretmocerus hayati]|uniref:Uncharacterized protein n=1 Tax=Eretmocerus hayati TaxID=131215 RepID=A0ACC2PLG8_9HYME|nr:hypothetical protein QAD02_020052 [Eretmocerus hayati]
MITRIKIFLAFITVILLWQAYKLRSIILENYEVQELAESVKVVDETNVHQVLITVYYEALCPDSKSFIKTELIPTYNKLEDAVRIQLIPYGKAETIIQDDNYLFKCQHGEPECEANIFHACSINKIKSTKKQLDVVACMMKRSQSAQSMFNSCAKNFDEYNDILNCSQSKEGRELLAHYGKLTQDLDPKASIIPTITLDDEANNEEKLKKILKNLLLEVCQRFDAPPKECTPELKAHLH